MRKKNIGYQEGNTQITQNELLTILEQAVRPHFTKRQLTQLTSERLLPQLRRTSRAGSNRPVYVWQQEVIEQAKYLYDLIEQGHPRYQIFLALWLRGYDVTFEPILQHWLRSVGTLLHNLTNEEQDPEDVLDHISSTLVQYVEPKWRFSPRPDKVIRGVGIDAWRELMEFLLDILAVPTYELDEMSYESLLRTLQRLNSVAQTNVDPGKTLSWILSLREVFTLPQYRNMLINATVEEWTQARDDYLRLCHFLQQLAAFFPHRNARLSAEMRQAVFLDWGLKLLPLLLTVRYAGYGDWIDKAFVSLNEFLNVFTNPEIRELLANM